MSLANLVLVFILLSFTGMGLMAIFVPLSITRQFGINSLSSDGRNEVRAVYGGFGLMVAVALCLALKSAEIRFGVCLSLGLAVAGMAGGRVLSAAMDRNIGPWPLFYLVLEAICSAGLFYAGGVI